MILKALFFIGLAYLIGSIPTGYIVVKIFKNEDIRTIGSGSTGATNVKRVMGKEWFFAVLLLDAFKGFLPVCLSRLFYNGFNAVDVLCAIAVILGHSKSIFLKFTGGKSVASGVGTILALNPLAGLAIAGVWAVIVWFSKYVSLGSIVALWLSPFIMWAFRAPLSYIAYCVLGALYITFLHRENVKRLIKGEENKVR